MKNINLYLIAFFAILGKSLAFTMGWPEVAALSGLLLKLSFDSHLTFRANQEKHASVAEQIKVAIDERIKPLGQEIIALKNKQNFIK